MKIVKTVIERNGFDAICMWSIRDAPTGGHLRGDLLPSFWVDSEVQRFVSFCPLSFYPLAFCHFNYRQKRETFDRKVSARNGIFVRGKRIFCRPCRDSDFEAFEALEDFQAFEDLEAFEVSEAGGLIEGKEA